MCVSLTHKMPYFYFFFFFFNDTATTEIYTLSLHDALPICFVRDVEPGEIVIIDGNGLRSIKPFTKQPRRFCVFEHIRSEEHTSELQSRQYLVCRLLLEKKKQILTSLNN